MKQIIAGLLCLISLLQCSSLASGAQTENQDVVIKLPDQISSAAKVYDSLILLSNSGIYRWTPGQTEIEMLEDHRSIVSFRYSEQRPDDEKDAALWDSLASIVFSDGRETLLLHPYTLEVTALHPNGSRLSRFSLPTEKLLYDNEGEDALREIKQLIFIDGVAFMLLGTDQAGEPWKSNVAVYDPQSNEFSILPIEDARGIYAGKEGEILVLRIAAYGDLGQQIIFDEGLYAYDLNSGFSGRLLSELIENVGGYVYDKTNQNVLYMHESQLFTLSEEGIETRAAYIPVGNIYSQTLAFLMSNDCYVVVDSGNLIVRSITRDTLFSQTVLLYMGNLDQQILLEYSAQWPDVSIIPAGDHVPDTSEVTSSILGRDSNIDLYVLDDLLSFYEVRDKGYAGTLNKNESLMAKSNRLHPAMKDVLMSQDQLSGFPIRIIDELWSINLSAWDRFNLGQQPRTLPELYELIEVWEKEYAEDNLDYSFIDSQYLSFYVHHILTNYILNRAKEEESLDFNTAFLRDAFSELETHRQLMTLTDEQLQRNMNAMYAIIFTYSFASVSKAGVDDEIYGPYPPPAIIEDEEPVYTARPSILFLNELGTQKEEALKFIDFYTDHVDIETRYKLFIDLDEPVRHNTYESNLSQQQLIVNSTRILYEEAEGAQKIEMKNQLEREEARLQRFQDDWLVSPEMIALYRNMSKHLIYPNAHAASLMRGRESFSADIKLYAQGQMSLDRFLDTLNKKARLIYWEAR